MMVLFPISQARIYPLFPAVIPIQWHRYTALPKRQMGLRWIIHMHL
ncbi:hypothetical protein NC652_022346 [Populus alba x Populus x berolinensis]|nr:hypothetical protein NC652_022346 [Populus alba x Populus x berolinensis]